MEDTLSKLTIWCNLLKHNPVVSPKQIGSALFGASAKHGAMSQHLSYEMKDKQKNVRFWVAFALRFGTFCLIPLLATVSVTLSMLVAAWFLLSLYIGPSKTYIINIVTKLWLFATANDEQRGEIIHPFHAFDALPLFDLLIQDQQQNLITKLKEALYLRWLHNKPPAFTWKLLFAIAFKDEMVIEQHLGNSLPFTELEIENLSRIQDAYETLKSHGLPSKTITEQMTPMIAEFVEMINTPTHQLFSTDSTDAAMTDYNPSMSEWERIQAVKNKTEQQEIMFQELIDGLHVKFQHAINMDLAYFNNETKLQYTQQNMMAVNTSHMLLNNILDIKSKNPDINVLSLANSHFNNNTVNMDLTQLNKVLENITDSLAKEIVENKAAHEKMELKYNNTTIASTM